MPLLVNPAATGHLNGSQSTRLSLAHRSLWNNAWTTEGYQGMAVGIDGRLCGGSSFFAFGLQLQRDWASQALFYHMDALASIAYHIKINKNKSTPIMLSAGFQSGIINYGTDLSNLKFDRQFGVRGFDPFAGSGEADLVGSRTQPDVGAGLQLYGQTRKKHEFSLGVAFRHVNNPIYSLLGNANRLGTSWTMHGAFNTANANNHKNAVLVRGFFRKQSVLGNNSRQWQALGGAFWNLKIGSQNNTILQAGGLLRVVGWQKRSPRLESIIPQIQIRTQGWLLGLSYDANITSLNTVPLGGFEVSFGWLFGNAKNCVVCPGS